MKMIEDILDGVHIRRPLDGYFPVGKDEEYHRIIGRPINEPRELFRFVLNQF
jgi:hypothetical protein